METAQVLINDALQELIVQAIEQPIEQVDFNIAKRYMNRMMAELAADGVTLGYTQIVNPADLVTIPDGAVNGLIYNLALHLATTYDVAVSPELAVKAADGKRIMTKIAVQPSPSNYPDSLPIGSGNTGENERDYTFYSEQPDTIDTENGGVIGLEQLP